MQDPFFYNQVCVERLLEKYRAHNQLIVACDFDDTIFDFYGKNDTYPLIIELLKECNDLNFPVVIYTARGKQHHWQVIDYMKQIGVKITGINEEVLSKHGDENSKLYYNILLDDKAGLRQAYEVLKETIIWIKSERHPYNKTVNDCKKRFNDGTTPFAGFWAI